MEENVVQWVKKVMKEKMVYGGFDCIGGNFIKVIDLILKFFLYRI